MSEGHIRKLLISGTSLLALGLSASAIAQDKKEKSENLLTLEEIVVTAQKREQNSQDVPIALNAFSASTVEKLAADNMRDLAIFTPGLEVSGNTQARFKIRGVNTSDFGVGTDPAVAVYVDGVYSTRSGASLVMFNDIERVEVLKGPQGTLFGRNTAAGAVSITTKQPSMDEFDASVQLRYGRYNKIKATGMVNVPISETMAVRANLVVNRRDGFVADAITGEKYGNEDNETGRIRFRWQPTDSTNVVLSYEFDRTNQDDDSVTVGLGTGNIQFPGATLGDHVAHGEVFEAFAPLLGLPLSKETSVLALQNNLPLPFLYSQLMAFGYNPANAGSDWDFVRDPSTLDGANPMGRLTSDIGNGYETRHLDGFALRIEHDFDFAKLTSISSYKKFTTSNLQDEDGTANPEFYFDTENYEENEHFYQELRLNGQTDRITWAMGGSFYKENAYQRSNTLATTNSIDTVLYNVGATPGVLAANLNPADGFLDSCEHLYFDSWSTYLQFSNIPLRCFDASFGGLSQALTGGATADLSFEGLANAVGTSWYGRDWREDMVGYGKTTSWGLFIDGTWAVTDKLNITAGLRYTSDKKSWRWEDTARQIGGYDELALPEPLASLFLMNGLPSNLADLHQALTAAVVGGNGDIVFSGASDYTREDSWSYLSPRAVVDYHVSDDVMVYASWAKGHKAGGHNSVEVNSSFNNEEVSNIEIGVKSTMMDGRMRLNASYWNYKYDDKQSISLQDVNGSGIPQYVTQTKDIKGSGIDLDWQFMATPNMRLFAQASYQDITCADNCEVRSGGVTYDTTGQPEGEPDFVGSYGFDYSYDLGDTIGSLNLMVIQSYTAANTYNDVCKAQGSCGIVSWGGTSWETGKERFITNARLTWSNPDSNIRVSVYGNNITDEKSISGIGGLLKDTMFAPVGSYSLGATYGVDLTYKF